MWKRSDISSSGCYNQTHAQQGEKKHPITLIIQASRGNTPITLIIQASRGNTPITDHSGQRRRHPSNSSFRPAEATPKAYGYKAVPGCASLKANIESPAAPTEMTICLASPWRAHCISRGRGGVSVNRAELS